MIKQAIKKELANKGWSVLRLANESGVRYPSLTNYLNSDNNLNSKNLEIIFKTLNLTIVKMGEKENYLKATTIRNYLGGNEIKSINSIFVFPLNAAAKRHFKLNNWYESQLTPITLRSLTKEMTYECAKEEGYSIPMSHFSNSDYEYDVDKDIIILNISLNELKKGWTEAKIEEYVKECYKNNTSFDSSIWLNRID